MTEDQLHKFGYEMWCAIREVERGKNEITDWTPSFIKKVFLFLATPYFLYQYTKIFFVLLFRSRKDVFGLLNLYIKFEDMYLKERGWIDS